MHVSDEKSKKSERSLEEIVEAHKTHPNSLKDEESTEAYNEEEAREAFGDTFFEQLAMQAAIAGGFKGDWWQLALLIGNLQRDKANLEIKDDDRLGVWNQWRTKTVAGSWRSEYIHLEHANLYGAHLEHANLEAAHLEHTRINGAHLEHANLEAAHLEHAYLGQAHLEHANLGQSHLEHADLSAARLDNVVLYRANLEQADVRAATGLLFDENRVVGMRIEGSAPDPWSVLRRNYTGPWFFIHLMLLGVFFAPYVAKALYLDVTSRSQEWLVEEFETLETRLPDVEVLRDYGEELKRRFRDELVQRPAWWVLLGVHKGVVPLLFALVVIFYNALRAYLTLSVSSLRDAEERSSTTPRLAEYYGACHPLSAKPLPAIGEIIRTWWKHPWELGLIDPRRWAKRIRERLRPETVRSHTHSQYTERSFVECLGLYRLHRVTNVLLYVALVAIGFNTLDWVMTTRIWVPIG